MPQRSRSDLQAHFANFKKPPQEDFWDWLGSFLHLQEDYNLLGLREYDPVRNYVPGDTAVYQGGIYLCNTATTGTWHTASWTEISTAAQVASLITEYDPATTYALSDAVRVGTRLFTSLTDGNLGNNPTDLPSTFWLELSPDRHGIIYDWGPGLWFKHQCVVYDNKLYRNMNANPWGWIISLGPAYFSFASELASGYWQEVSPSVGGAFPNPTRKWATLSGNSTLSGWEQRTNYRNDGNPTGFDLNESVTTGSVTMHDTDFLTVVLTAGKVIAHFPPYVPIPTDPYDLPAASFGLGGIPSFPANSCIYAIGLDKVTGGYIIAAGPEFPTGTPKVYPTFDSRTYALLQMFEVPGTATSNADIQKLLSTNLAPATVRYAAKGYASGNDDYAVLNVSATVTLQTLGLANLSRAEVFLQQSADGSTGFLHYKGYSDTDGTVVEVGASFTPTDMLNTLATASMVVYPAGGPVGFQRFTLLEQADGGYYALTFSTDAVGRFSAEKPGENAQIINHIGDRVEVNLEEAVVPPRYDNTTNTLDLRNVPFGRTYYLTAPTLTTVTIDRILWPAGWTQMMQFECQPGLTATFNPVYPSDLAEEGQMLLYNSTSKTVDGDHYGYLLLKPDITDHDPPDHPAFAYLKQIAHDNFPNFSS